MAKTILYMNSFKELPVSNNYVTFLGGGSLSTTEGHLTKLGVTVDSLTGQLNALKYSSAAEDNHLLTFNISEINDIESFTTVEEIIISFSIFPGATTTAFNAIGDRPLTVSCSPREWNFIQISFKKTPGALHAFLSINKEEAIDIGVGAPTTITISEFKDQIIIDDLSIVLYDTSPGLINEQFIASTTINAITDADGAFSSSEPGSAAAVGDIADIDTKWIGTTIADSEVTVAHSTEDIKKIKDTLNDFIFDPNSLLINGVSLTTNAKVQGDITNIVQGLGTDIVITEIHGGSDAEDAEYTSTTTYHSVGDNEVNTPIGAGDTFNTKIKFTN